MSEWRQDPLSGRWVIIAPDRGQRPNEFAGAPTISVSADDCPFCPGHENLTTAECLALGRPPGAPADGPGWRLRIFPNKYPALAPVDPTRNMDAAWPVRPGVGRHEVVVTTPEHDAGLQDLDPSTLAELLGAVRQRVRVLEADPVVRHVLVFFNQGSAAGATLAHSHGQILAGSMVPPLVVDKERRLAAHHRETGGCLLCDLLAREEEDGARLVAAVPAAVALAPWASRFPYEVLVVPRRHVAGLAAASDEDLAGVATVLAEALAGLSAVAPAPALNLVVHSAPVARKAADGSALFHWHLEVLPRLAGLAGFEAGSGFAINAVVPEQAARRLRGEET